MNLSGVIAQLISLFLMMFVGYIAARAQIITPDFRKKLSTFTLSVAAPGVILSSALQSDMPASGMLSVLLIATLFFFIMIPLAALLSRVLSKNAQEKKLDQLMLVFTNVGFMGIPVAQALYGMNGVAMVSMFILTFNLAFFSYGLMLISGEMTFNLRSLCNPCIFAALGALFFALTGLHLPGPIESTLASIGSMNTPLAMIIIGASLAHSDLRVALTNPRLYKISLARMLIMPLCMLAIMRLLPIDPMLAGVAVCEAAMPVAGNCAMASDMYTPEDMTASHAVIVSTLMSALSLPVICWLISVAL
ncbi:MAG: AEC family transporter [Clostridia bacterium]|nr:AEC family transporter [Clostridia bacterium]